MSQRTVPPFLHSNDYRNNDYSVTLSHSHRWVTSSTPPPSPHTDPLVQFPPEDLVVLGVSLLSSFLYTEWNAPSLKYAHTKIYRQSTNAHTSYMLIWWQRWRWDVMSYCYWPQVGQMPYIACSRYRNGQFEYFTADCLVIRYGRKIAGSIPLYSIIQK